MKNIKLKFLRALSLLLASLIIINPFGTPMYAATSEVTEQPQKIIENNTDGDNIITNSDVGPLSSHTPALFNNSEIEKLTEYAIGGVCALASFAAISLAVLLPSSSDPNHLYAKMGGNQKYIEEYKQFLTTHRKQVEETYNVFNSSLCDATSLYKRELNVISCLRDHFPCNRLTEDQKKLIIRIVYCWLSLPEPKPDTSFCGQDIFILLPVYEKFIKQTKELNQDDEAKVCYIFSKFMVTSEEYKVKLRNNGISDYFASHTFWPEIPERDRVYPDKLINQYINDPLPSLPADMWFTRLGGNQEFINYYEDLAKKYDNDTLDIGLSDDDKRNIKVDLPRTFPSNNPEDNRKLRPIIKRIIYIVCGKIYTYYHYWQGYNDILAMVCSKFLQTLSNVDDITNNMETEAKICYVFSELLRVCHQDKKDDSALADIGTNHDLINTFEISISAKEREQLENIINLLSAKPYFTRDITMYNMAKIPRLLIENLEPKTTRSTEANALYTNSIKIWDRIISDDNMLDKTTNKLDYKKALQTLFNIQLSLLLERSQNTDLTDLKRLSSTDLINFIAYNDKPVLPTH